MQLSAQSTREVETEERELKDALDVNVLWTRLTDRMNKSEKLVAQYNENLCNWMIRVVGNDLKSLDLQKQLFEAAAQRYCSVEIKYEARALLKCKVTNKETCFPTTHHLHMVCPGLVNTVFIKPDRYKEKLIVVCRWRPSCEKRGAGETERDCKPLDRSLKEAASFREYMGLPKLDDCKLEDCLLHLVWT
jgi:hypothetical protein